MERPKRTVSHGLSNVERHSLPPFGLQRNRKTPERITIGKLLYFCSVEFMGQFLVVGGDTVLPATGALTSEWPLS
jgi:hypothetical protein